MNTWEHWPSIDECNSMFMNPIMFAVDGRGRRGSAPEVGVHEARARGSIHRVVLCTFCNCCIIKFGDITLMMFGPVFTYSAGSPWRERE